MKLFAGQHMERGLNATPVPIEITAQERGIDRVLADSFPASDSPPWTLGVPRDRANESAKVDASAKSHTLINHSNPRTMMTAIWSDPIASRKQHVA
jgi:hypothetical protein